MPRSVRRALRAGALTGGLTVLGVALATALATTPASATTTPGISSGQHGLLSGNQVGIGVTVPVHLTGHQLTVLGEHNSTGTPTSGGLSGSGVSVSHGASSSGDGGTLSGNQVGLVASAPITVAGNQATVAGHDNSTGTSGRGSSSGTSGSGSTTGRHGTVAGNQVGLGLGVPVDACGNQVTVVGQANRAAGCTTGAPGAAGGHDTTSGTDGTLAGNQSWLGLVVPITASGNQATVLGDGNRDTAEGTASGTGPAGGNVTSGQDGTGSGNQVVPGLALPLTADGNQVTVIGHGNATTGGSTSGSTGGSTSGSTAGSTTGAGGTTSGQGGTGAGNQVIPGVTAPVTVGGNQVTVLGAGNTTTGRGTVSDPAPTGGTSGTTGTIGSAPTSAGSSHGTTGVASPGAQAGPAVFDGVLPNTGSPAGLLLWLILGLLLLAGGLIVSVGQLDRLRLGRPREVTDFAILQHS